MTKQLRVLLADDQAPIRAGFRVLLESAPDLLRALRAGASGFLSKSVQRADLLEHNWSSSPTRPAWSAPATCHRPADLTGTTAWT